MFVPVEKAPGSVHICSFVYSISEIKVTIQEAKNMRVLHISKESKAIPDAKLIEPHMARLLHF